MSWAWNSSSFSPFCEYSLYQGAQNLILVPKMWLLSVRYSMAIVNLVSWSPSLKILLVHFVNRQLLYHTDELFQPDFLLFGSWWQEKKQIIERGRWQRIFSEGTGKQSSWKRWRWRDNPFCCWFIFGLTWRSACHGVKNYFSLQIISPLLTCTQ